MYPIGLTIALIKSINTWLWHYFPFCGSPFSS
jgi:hypothetical protein